LGFIKERRGWDSNPRI